MDIEELNRTQIVLLVILVSFVTSIATGIVTVALLAQAPPAVTQTVNHVIQRTVESVVPAVGGTTETIKETTVVVKEEDLVTETIANTFARIASVHETVSSSSPVVALGVLVQGGLLITDSGVVGDTHLIDFGATSSVYTVADRYSEIGIAVLKGSGGGAFRIADTDKAKLGQSVIALPSASGTRVGIGSLISRYKLATVDELPVRAIETTVTGTLAPGAPLVNVFGEVLGVNTRVSAASGSGTFVSFSDLMPIVLNVRGTATSTPQ
ncbi:MAG: hypothetical protein RLZZ283_531 [Candidatus Parcubacteria bacterium]